MSSLIRLFVSNYAFFVPSFQVKGQRTFEYQRFYQNHFKAGVKSVYKGGTPSSFIFFSFVVALRLPTRRQIKSREKRQAQKFLVQAFFLSRLMIIIAQNGVIFFLFFCLINLATIYFLYTTKIDRYFYTLFSFGYLSIKLQK